MASSTCAATGNNIFPDRKLVIDELTRGREFADRLRLMLRETGDDGSVLPAQDLVGQILETFSQSLYMLSAGGESEEDYQVPTVVNSSGLKSEDSGGSCQTPKLKDGRGCHKRRRASETLIKETPTAFDDGHAWRKYGQKIILKSRYPRNYFRCTHKFDQGCQASKQVQQIQDDPTVFRTTYHGHHTCNNLLKSPHQFVIDAEKQDSSIIWSFQSGDAYKPKNGLVFDSTEVKDVIKHENEEELGVKSSPCGPDYYISPDKLTVFDTPTDHLAAFSSASDCGDVMSSDVFSCTASTYDSIDMEMMMGSVFGDFLEFGSLS